MVVRPLTPGVRARTRRWAPRLGVLAFLLMVDAALPPGRHPSLINVAYALLAAVVVAASVTAMLYVRNRRVVVSDQGLAVSDLLGLARSVPRAELTELVGMRLLVPVHDSSLGFPLACFRGSKTRLRLAGPLWNAEELEATAEKLGLRVGNEAHRVNFRTRRRRRLSISG